MFAVAARPHCQTRANSTRPADGGIGGIPVVRSEAWSIDASVVFCPLEFSALCYEFAGPMCSVPPVYQATIKEQAATNKV